MCCDHCHREITPGTENTVLDRVKGWVRVCTLCVPFVASIVFGQTSPTQAPPPIINPARSVVQDSGSLGSANTLLSEWYRRQLSQFLVVQDSDDNLVASLTVPPAVPAPARLPEEKPNPENQPHPPEQGSTFVGISGSGAMSNTAAVTTISSWDPPDPAYSSLARIFEPQSSARGVMLKIGPVAPQHRPFLPRARRNCSRS